MVLLIIDTQKLIMNNKLYAYDLFMKNIKQLIKAAREHDIEVIYVRHDDGQGAALTKGVEGYEIAEEFKPLKDEKIVDKEVNSVFKDTGLLKYLKDKGVNEVIVTGLQTDYCIDATVKGAFEHGFKVIVPSYSNTSVDNKFMSGENSYKYYNEFMWPKRYATCCCVEDTIQSMINKKVRINSRLL